MWKLNLAIFMDLVPHTHLKYNIYMIHMGAALAELCFLGNKTEHSQVGYIGHSKLRKLKLQTYQSISEAKVMEKPPANVQHRENKVRREGKYPLLAENVAQKRSRTTFHNIHLQMTETPQTKYWA